MFIFQRSMKPRALETVLQIEIVKPIKFIIPLDTFIYIPKGKNPETFPFLPKENLLTLKVLM